MNIHIGKMIKAEFKRQGRTVKWLTEQLHCNRSNIYNIFNRKNIDVEMLIKLSIVLKHNFLLDIAPLAEEREKDENKSNN
ncbi:MAG: XRE family transcriptional regulator [Bacteroidales bacterium]|nr:XRE family transcriptional regulator [Bacteroidales bacterium]